MNLDELRTEIVAIDNEILVLLVKRFKLSEKVGHFKATNNIPVVSKEREKEIFERLRAKAAEAGLDGDVAEDVWRAIIDKVVINHKKIKESLND